MQLCLQPFSTAAEKAGLGSRLRKACTRDMVRFEMSLASYKLCLTHSDL